MSDEKLLTLTEISTLTGFSFPALLRYKRQFLNEIPHEGSGRTMRFPESAVAVFTKIKSEQKRGRPKKSEASPVTASASSSRRNNKRPSMKKASIKTKPAVSDDLNHMIKDLISRIKRLESFNNKLVKSLKSK